MPEYWVRNRNNTKWEKNRGGTFTAGTPDRLSRNVILSTNGNAAVNWTTDDLPLTIYNTSDADVSEGTITGWLATAIHALLRAGASWMEDYQRVFHHRDPVTGFDALIFSLPGILALTGVNRQGLAVCVNSLVQLDGDPCGLPVVGVIRRLLESADHPAAIATLRSVRHASGQTYTIGDHQTFGAYEVSRSSIVEVSGIPGRPAVCHTNHPLANPDSDLFQQATAADTPERRVARTANSRARLAALEQGLGDDAAYSVDGVKSLLASRQDPDHPLSRELGGGGEVIDYTLACVVFEPGPPALMHLAAGPPSTTGFRPFICDSGVAPARIST